MQKTGASRSYVCGLTDFLSTTYAPPSRIKDTIFSNLVKFAGIFKFNEKYLNRNGLHTYSMGTSCSDTFQYLTVGKVRKIWSGKFQHTPYSFGFKYALITVIVISFVFHIPVTCRMGVCVFVTQNISAQETVDNFLLTFFQTLKVMQFLEMNLN